MDNNIAITNLLIQSENRKYYVYRLIDPRTYQTFYVGKGCGDRAFQHVKDAESLKDKNNDELSLKIQQIQQILTDGKNVIVVFHRRGMTEKEAFEVEAALIDCYPGLTNIQSGHGIDRGLISADDLNTLANAKEYDEPNEKYIIIKVKQEVIMGCNGILYDAVRKAWRGDLNKAKNYKYVLAVVNGIVRDVFEVDEWYLCYNRIAFKGKSTNDKISSLKGMRIPKKYMEKGSANPFMYKKE